MQIALNYLCRNWRRPQPQLFANITFYARREMGACPHSSGKLSDRDCFTRILQPVQRAAKFVIHESHFEAESCRLGVNAVAAANHRSEFVLARFAANGLAK